MRQCIRPGLTGLTLCLGLALTTGAVRAERAATSVHVFGNSLVNHISDSPATAVPWWLARLARAGDKRLALSGQFGFLRSFARDGMADRWSFDRVARPRGAVDTVLVTPANFIQYRPPDLPFEGDNPDGSTPLSATLTAIDAALARAPGARVLIYEGWPDMGGYSRRFPPSARALRRWHGYALAEYHHWFRDYVAALRAARPETEIALLPVSSVLSGLQTGVLKDVPVEALYSDDAPHGTPTLYFLAALVTYTALYDAPAPAGFDLPDMLHPAMRDRYPRITKEIAQALGLRDRAAAPVTAPAPATAPPGIGLADPSLAMGLSGIVDWTNQHPFIDVMKTARPWIGHRADDWGAFPTQALRDGGYLDDRGWPTALPPGAQALESFVLTDQPEAATYLRGRYLLRYEGTGVLRVTGRADNVRYNYDTREIRFDYAPGDGPVALRLTETDADDPLRDITIIHEDHLALHQAGAVFNPLWIDRIADLRLVRFMDWQFTNGSDQTTWAARPTPRDATYGWRGAPVEVMVALANRIGADPWVNMPHAANDAYMREFARYMRDHLDPGLKVHVEYSNELWNFIFPQAIWARDAATRLWGGEAPGDAWMQFAGMRAAQMADIWRDVFADTPARLSVVVGVHSGWPGLEQTMLTAPLAVAGGQIDAAPASRFDAYAVTGYFGHELGGEDMADTVRGWITASRAVARARAAETGTDPEAALAAHGYDLAFDLAAQALRQGSLNELTTTIFPYHAGVAARHGMDLVMYEGGTHVVGHGAVTGDDALTEFFTAFNYSPQMGALYEELLAGWRGAGGTIFNAFVDVASPSKWGSWGALRHLGDDTIRWDVLMRANATPPHWDDRRPPGTFLHGVLRRARDDAAARLAGTAKADILIGGPGDDRLIGHGGSDRLHGGAGEDTARLPGRRAGYAIAREGAQVILRGRGATVTLVDVERVEFTGAPDETLTLADAL